MTVKNGMGMEVIAVLVNVADWIVIQYDLNHVQGLIFNSLRRYWLHINHKGNEMKTRLIGILLAAIASTATNNILAAGFKQIVIQQPNESDLTIGVWYPSEAPVPTEPNTNYGLSVALDAAISGANGGLLLISHGYGGWYAGHADTAIALADAGYVIAAPSHAGNTWSDMSSPIEKWMLDRPRHISRVIDHMLTSDPISAHLDSEKIGIYGFSAGGYTALALLGAVPDFDHAKNHCRTQPQEFVCAEGWVDAMFDAKVNKLPAKAWGADKRIKAAVIAAPGWGFAYPENGLANVTADIQLWSGQLDTSVPTETNAAFLASQLPSKPETYWTENANHFAFLLVPCRESFKQEDPEEYKLVCEDAPGFDRHDFHNRMHHEMNRFFQQALGVGPRGGTGGRTTVKH